MKSKKENTETLMAFIESLYKKGWTSEEIDAMLSDQLRLKFAHKYVLDSKNSGLFGEVNDEGIFELMLS